MAIRQPLVNSLLMQNPQFPNNNLLSLLSPTTVPQMNPGGILTSNLQAPMVAPTTAPTPAPTLGLLDPTGEDRATAFLKGLGAAGPALMAAGAPTTDPGGRLKGIAAAAQARQTATNTYLQNERARKAQAATLAVAQAKAAREKQLHDIAIAKHQNFTNLMKRLTPGSASVPTPGAVSSTASSVAPGTASSVAPLTSVSGVVPSVSNVAASQQKTGIMLDPLVMAGIMADKDPAAALNRIMLSQTDPSKMFGLGGVLTNKGRIDLEKTYRTELRPVVEKIQETNRKMRMVQSGIADASGSGDIQAVTSFIKMIDTGVVTAGELSVQQGAMGVIEQLELFRDSKTKGKVLGDTLRENFKRLSQNIMFDTVETYRPQINAAKVGALELGLRWDTQIWRGGDLDFKRAPANTIKNGRTKTEQNRKKKIRKNLEPVDPLKP